MTISHLPALLLAADATDSATADAFPAFPAITSPCAGAHASRTTSYPSCCLALALFSPCHAPRRFQNHPVGRHRDAAVERPLQSTPPSSSERPSPTRTPGVDFARSFALFSLPHRRTPPPPRWYAGELTPPRSRHCRPAPPLQPPPLVAPRPSAAPRPLPLAQTSPELPRRRAPSPQAAARRRHPISDHPSLDSKHPEVRLGLL